MDGRPQRGISRADFAQLYLPPLLDPVYGYQACNIEAQLRDQHSFLQWFRRLLAVRKQHPVFGLGSFEALSPDNPAIFAFIRKFEDDVILSSTTSRHGREAELDSVALSRACIRSSSWAGSASPVSENCPIY